jgi:hypothetical protein
VLLPPGSRQGVVPPPLVLSPAEAAFLDAEAVLSLDLSSARNATKARLVWPGSWSAGRSQPTCPKRKSRQRKCRPRLAAPALCSTSAQSGPSRPWSSTCSTPTPTSARPVAAARTRRLHCDQGARPVKYRCVGIAATDQSDHRLQVGQRHVAGFAPHQSRRHQGASGEAQGLPSSCDVSPQERSKLEVFSIDFFS